jgi:hypothetical protein
MMLDILTLAQKECGNDPAKLYELYPDVMRLAAVCCIGRAVHEGHTSMRVSEMTMLAHAQIYEEIKSLLNAADQQAASGQ